MSHRRHKAEYISLGAYGNEEKHTLYCHENLSCDYTTFYDEEGNVIFSFGDCDHPNIMDAMICIYNRDNKHNVKREEISGLELDQIIKNKKQ